MDTGLDTEATASRGAGSSDGTPHGLGANPYDRLNAFNAKTPVVVISPSLGWALFASKAFNPVEEKAKTRQSPPFCRLEPLPVRSPLFQLAIIVLI